MKATEKVLFGTLICLFFVQNSFAGHVLIKSDCIGETFTSGYPHPSYADRFATFPHPGVIGVWNSNPYRPPVNELVILKEHFCLNHLLDM